MNRKEFVRDSLRQSAWVKEKIEKLCSDDILDSAEKLTEVFRAGKKLLICGNGGSAADSQHIAAEFMIRLSRDLDRPALPAIALTTDTSNLTAGGNDIGFENVFARNVEGLGNSGDALLVISTSGSSKNLIKAVSKAKEKKMVTFGFLGGSGGELAGLVDKKIIVPSENTQRIQEGHITIAHIVCEIVERSLFDDSLQ